LVLISAARSPIHGIGLKHPRSNLGHGIQIGRFTLNARRVMERFNRVRPTSIQRRRGFLPHVTRPRIVALEQGRRRHGRCCPHCAPGPQAQIRMLQHRMEYESKVPGDFYLDIGAYVSRPRYRWCRDGATKFGDEFLTSTAIPHPERSRKHEVGVGEAPCPPNLA
jgi:hypothetical protein